MSASKDKAGLSRRDFMFGGLRKLRQRAQEKLDENAATQEDDSDVTPRDAASAEDALVRANAAYAYSDYEAAIEGYRECLQKMPRHTDARQRLGYCLYRTEQYVQAKVEFERVIRERGKDNFSSLYLGLTLARMDKRDKAVTAWRGYFNPNEVRIMRELNVQTALLESSEGYDLEEAIEGLEEAIAARKEELQTTQG